MRADVPAQLGALAEAGDGGEGVERVADRLRRAGGVAQRAAHAAQAHPPLHRRGVEREVAQEGVLRLVGAPEILQRAPRDEVDLAAQQPLVAGGRLDEQLIEVRDEWDLPFAGAVSIALDGGAPVVAPLPAGSRGVVALPAGASAVEVAAPGCVLSWLPSDDRCALGWSGPLDRPTHFSLQAIPMAIAPAAADEGRLWFAPNTAPRPRFTAVNRVTAIRDGVDVFRAYVEALRTVRAPGHRVLLGGWFPSRARCPPSPVPARWRAARTARARG